MSETAWREGFTCDCGQVMLVKAGPTWQAPTHCIDCGRRLKARHRMTGAAVQGMADQAVAEYVADRYRFR